MATPDVRLVGIGLYTQCADKSPYRVCIYGDCSQDYTVSGNGKSQTQNGTQWILGVVVKNFGSVAVDDVGLSQGSGYSIDYKLGYALQPGATAIIQYGGNVTPYQTSLKADAYYQGYWYYPGSAIPVNIDNQDACSTTPVQHNYTAPPGYTLCAYEGGQCGFTDVEDMVYGVDGNFQYKYGVQGPVSCSSSTFGGADPSPGVKKACYTKPSATGGGPGGGPGGGVAPGGTTGLVSPGPLHWPFPLINAIEAILTGQSTSSLRKRRPRKKYGIR